VDLVNATWPVTAFNQAYGATLSNCSEGEGSFELKSTRDSLTG
jgi:hypothetical protein